MREPQSACSMLKLIFSLDSVAVKSRTGIDTSPNEICADANARGITVPLFYLNALGFVQWLLGHTRESIERCVAFPAAAFRPTETWRSERDWKGGRGRLDTRCTRFLRGAAFRGIASSTLAVRSACAQGRIRMSCSGCCWRR